MNPYEVTPNRKMTASRCDHLVTVLAIVLVWTGLVIGSWKTFGPNGLGGSLYFCVVTWAIMARSSNPRFLPLNRRAPNFAEILLVLLVTMELHALATPSVCTLCLP